MTSSELYDPAAGIWTKAGPLNTARDYHTATLLDDGEVLVAGGFGLGAAGALSSAELYDANMGRWTIANPMATARRYHTATLLPNGRVLVVGGNNSASQWLASSELYDSMIFPAATIYLENVSRLPGGAVMFGFTYSSGASNTVMAAASPSAPSNTWTTLGAAVETTPGQFQFIDQQAANFPQRFYRVLSQ